MSIFERAYGPVEPDTPPYPHPPAGAPKRPADSIGPVAPTTLGLHQQCRSMMLAAGPHGLHGPYPAYGSHGPHGPHAPFQMDLELSRRMVGQLPLARGDLFVGVRGHVANWSGNRVRTTAAFINKTGLQHPEPVAAFTPIAAVAVTPSEQEQVVVAGHATGTATQQEQLVASVEATSIAAVEVATPQQQEQEVVAAAPATGTPTEKEQAVVEASEAGKQEPLPEEATGPLAEFHNVYKPLLYSQDEVEVLRGTQYVRKKLSVSDPPIKAIRESGILPRLVELLRRDGNPALQVEAAWALTNIASGNHEDCQDVVDHKAVPECIRLMETCEDLPTLEQVVWLLGNIAGDSVDLRNMVVHAGVVAPLLANMEKTASKTTSAPSVSFLRQAAWLLSNLCRPSPEKGRSDLLSALPVVVAVLMVPDQDMEVVKDGCWALSYMISQEDVYLDKMFQQQDCRKLLEQVVAWFAGPKKDLVVPCMRLLGNMISGNETHTQAALDAGALPVMVSGLIVPDVTATIRKEIVWTLSNVAAGTGPQIQALVDTGVFPKALDVLRTALESKSKNNTNLIKEFAHLLANPWDTKISTSLAQDLLKADWIRALVLLLDSSIPTPSLQVVITGLSQAVDKGRAMMNEIAQQATPPPAQAAAPDDEQPAAGTPSQEAPDGEQPEAETPPQAAADGEQPVAVNPVVEAMRASGAKEKLQALEGYEGLSSTVINSLLEELQ